MVITLPNGLTSLEDVQRARARIGALCLRTPVVLAQPHAPGEPLLWIKAESLQHTGSFKLRGTRDEGANVILRPPTDTTAHAKHLAATLGLTVVPPDDDAHIIAGQGTIGLELSEQLDDLDVVLLPRTRRSPRSWRAERRYAPGTTTARPRTLPSCRSA